MRHTMILAALLLVAGVAQGKNEAPAIDAAKGFDAQRTQVLADLEDGKTYAEISSADRNQVRMLLERMYTKINAAGGAEQLREADRVAVFNDQEQVNTILTRARADSRLVCTREKATGSHRPQNRCLTVAERRRAREFATEEMRRSPPKALEPGG